MCTLTHNSTHELLECGISSHTHIHILLSVSVYITYTISTLITQVIIVAYTCKSNLPLVFDAKTMSVISSDPSLMKAPACLQLTTELVLSLLIEWRLSVWHYLATHYRSTDCHTRAYTTHAVHACHLEQMHRTTLTQSRATKFSLLLLLYDAMGIMQTLPHVLACTHISYHTMVYRPMRHADTAHKTDHGSSLQPYYLSRILPYAYTRFRHI